MFLKILFINLATKSLNNTTTNSKYVRSNKKGKIRRPG